jgi:hypothetical protein
VVQGAQPMKRKLKKKKLSKAEMAISVWMDDYECDIQNTIHVHFEDWEKKKKRNTRRLLDWTDVSQEAQRVYELLFHEKCGEYSPMTALLDGVAASAYCLAMENVAQHLGVSGKAVKSLAYENKGDGDADFFLLECKKLDNEP